jgi:hypothetical protein
LVVTRWRSFAAKSPAGVLGVLDCAGPESGRHPITVASVITVISSIRAAFDVRRTGPTVARFGVAPVQYAAGKDGHDRRLYIATTGHPLDPSHPTSVKSKAQTSRLPKSQPRAATLAESVYILAPRR